MIRVFAFFAAAALAAAETVTLLQYSRPYNAVEPSSDVPFPMSSARSAPFAAALFENDDDFNQGIPHYAQGAQTVPIAGAAASALPLGSSLAGCSAAAFDPTGYSVSVTISGSRIEVYIAFDAQNARVAVICPTSGACGFGPSPQLTMAGTDAAVGWVNDSTSAPTLLDVYAFQTGVKPSVDRSQDTTLISAYQGDTSTCMDASAPTSAPTAAPATE